MAGSLGWLLAILAGLAGTALLIFRELKRRWVSRVVDHLDHLLWRSVSRFHRRYREFMLSSLRYIDLKGLATVGFYTPELDEVFVDVSLAYRAPHDVPDSVIAQIPQDVTHRHSIDDFLDGPQPVVLAVVGVPGSGKTTLLRRTASVICRDHRARQRTVPILLYLRDHVATIIANPSVALPELLRATLGRYGSNEPPGWFERRLADGDCVVLLDGLDEVAKPEDRKKVAGWAERQTKQYPRNDFVITSRPQGYRTATIDGAIVLQVRSFTSEQVIQFVQRWYLAVERHSTGATTEEIRSRSESAAADLIRRLDSAPDLYDLTVNPLLLTMIANVHRYRGALPGSRADLYGEICQVMLWRRQEAKNLPIALSGDKKEALLSRVAFVMMQRRVRDMSRDAILAELAPAVRRISTRLTEEDFLVDVSSNGLLIERETGLYSFAHLTFQEYLAATHIRAKSLIEVLVKAVDDEWWREAVLLYTARSDADPIVEACLNSGSIPAISLAFSCDKQGSELAPELRKSLEDLLDSSGEGSDHYRLVTSVILQSHLRQLSRTKDGCRVCVRPMTGDLFDRYLKDTKSSSVRRVDLATEDPVVGVSGRDGVAFARWVNKITGGDPHYRLPTRAEINDPAVQRPMAAQKYSVWVESEDGHGLPELWTPTGVGHPHTIDGTVVLAQVKNDMSRSESALIRLLLLRSTAVVRALARDNDPDLDRDRVRNLIEVFAGFFEAIPDLDLDQALDRSFYHTVSYDQTQESGLGLALDLTRALVGIMYPVSTFDRARAINLDLDNCLELARALHRTRDVFLDPANNVGLNRVLHLDNSTRDLDSFMVQSDVYHALTEIAGVALSRALFRVENHNTAVEDVPAGFAIALIDEAFAGDATAFWTISLDVLPGMTNDCRGELLARLNVPSTVPHVWASRLADRFADLAVPIFAQPQLLTTETASTIRLMALCLAVEADIRQMRPLGEKFRELAAGVTLLELRATGGAPVTETLMLATT